MQIFLLLLQVSLATANANATFEEWWARGRDQLIYGQYAEAERTLRRALRETETSSPKPTSLGVMLNDLAEVCRHLGNYSEAARFYDQSTSILRAQPDASRELVLALGNQGTMFREVGQIDHSVALFEESLSIAKKVHLERDPVFGAILNGLAADIIASKGNLKKAESLLEQSLRLRKEILGPDHLDVSETLNNLGTVLYQRKQYKKAEAVLEQALAITEKNLGPDHPDVAVTLSNLGVIEYELQRYQDAEKVFRRALNIRERKLPPNHPSLASTLLNLARVIMNSNRNSEAQELLQRAVAIRNERPRDVDIEVVLTLEQYATALRLNGHAADAAVVETRARQMRAELKYVVRAFR